MRFVIPLVEGNNRAAAKCFFEQRRRHSGNHAEEHKAGGICTVPYAGGRCRTRVEKMTSLMVTRAPGSGREWSGTEMLPKSASNHGAGHGDMVTNGVTKASSATREETVGCWREAG